MSVPQPSASGPPSPGSRPLATRLRRHGLSVCMQWLVLHAPALAQHTHALFLPGPSLSSSGLFAPGVRSLGRRQSARIVRRGVSARAVPRKQVSSPRAILQLSCIAVRVRRIHRRTTVQHGQMDHEWGKTRRR